MHSALDLVKRGQPYLLGLNLALALVSGGLLLNGGMWRPLLLGVLGFSIGRYVFPYLSLPSVLLMGVMNMYRTKLAVVWGAMALAYLWTISVTAFYVAFVTMSAMAQGADFVTAGVLLVWGTAAGLAVWNVIAIKAADNVIFGMMMALFQLTGLALLVLFALRSAYFPMDFQGMFLFYALPPLVVIGALAVKEERGHLRAAKNADG